MRAMLSVVVLDACTGGGSSPPYEPPPNDQFCHVVSQQASCASGIAATEIHYAGGGGTSHTMCSKPPDLVRAACSTRCGAEGLMHVDAELPDEILGFAGKPDVLCAETPEAKLGDPCDVGTVPCLPTRARLNPDGTVAGQDYLACDLSVHRCSAVSPPGVFGELPPCDPAVVAEFGKPDVTGVVATSNVFPAPACLIAWDAAAQASRSGQTNPCFGDWDCPAGALCDDQLPRLTTVVVAVCKPGPRGLLLPSMLAP